MTKIVDFAPEAIDLAAARCEPFVKFRPEVPKVLVDTREARPHALREVVEALFCPGCSLHTEKTTHRSAQAWSAFGGETRPNL